MAVPAQPKIYHIIHVDRLPSVIADGCLWCDTKIIQHNQSGTSIGMKGIKQRRQKELVLANYPDLHVGDCVPFYFCPRSIMLYLLFQANHSELNYHGGQDQIVHLEADLHASVTWAQKNNYRWVFTLSNAGAYYFEDRNSLTQLNEINWDAVRTNRWSGNGIDPSVKEGKQAEFLMESNFPWQLIERIGVHSPTVYQQVLNALPVKGHRPQVAVRADWYY